MPAAPAQLLASSAAPPALRLDGVGKSYGDPPVTVLAPLKLRVAPGEFVAILGPSGCGKSTLLRLLSGLDAPSTGTLEIDGRPPGDHEDLAYVFQDPTLLPWQRVGANVETFLRLRRLPRAERRRRRDDALALVRLADRAEAFPRELSGGQRMRVSLARALATHPRLLLLDEPFAALDEMARDRLGEELHEIHRRQGWTAVFVTHSVAEAVFLASRILLFAPRPGRLAHEIPIDLPYPRDHDTRRAPDYLRLVAAVSARLRTLDPGPPGPAA